MQVGVLGPLLVRVDSRDLTPRGQRLRDVLVVLLQHRGRPVPADVLLDLVWGEAAVGLDGSAVHTVIARLRRQLGPNAISSDGIGYLLDRGVGTDEDDFASLVAAARDSLGRGDHPGARRSYRSALGIWRGPEAYADTRAELIEADRARLTDLRATVIEELATDLLECADAGSSAEALELTGGLITSQPLRERPYQLAMLAAYRCHRQAEALAMYRDLRRRLRAELGIEPTTLTAELHERVLRQDPSLNPRHPSTSLPMSSLTGASNLPAPVSPLIGRLAELGSVLDGLTSGHRLITMTGPGGVGKSRLLVELGARRQESKSVVYSSMSGLIEVGPDELAGAIAAGLFDLDPRRPPVESLIASLTDGNWLLLIDEAEWVVDPLAEVVTVILAQCRGVRIVLTSRVPLDVSGELLITIDPLECPGHDVNTPTILQSPAVQFLVHLLADRAVTVDAEPATAALLAVIARRADGLPLALELAAGQASGRSLADLANLADTMLDVPAPRRSSNVRHRSLRDTLRWSMNRLDSDHRIVLRRLTVFIGRFDAAGAAAVCGSIADVDDIVRSLAKQALIHVERNSASRLTFRLLRAVRDLAHEELRTGDLADAQALHRRWHAGLCRAGRADLVDGALSHPDDYLEALRTALESRDVTTLADLALTLAEHWRRTGGQVVGLKWLGRVLDSAVLNPLDRARVQVHRAALALHHVPELVLPDTEAALAVLAADPDEPLLVLAGVVRAVELSARGHWRQAADDMDAAVRVARRAAGEPLIRALSAQANVHAVIDDADGAAAAIAEVQLLIDESTPPATRIVAGTNIGLAMLNLDRPADALRLLDLVGPDVGRVTGRRPPDFYLLCRGWAELGCGAVEAALGSFLAGVPAHAPGIADRQSAEIYLGVGCALTQLGHPAAARTLAAALELTDRVQLAIPPALGRKVSAAGRQLAAPAPGALSIEPTAELLDRLQRTLAAVVEQFPTARHVVP
jgi:predicted ATPase/DNA-binding SARP family transcriptional activator